MRATPSTRTAPRHCLSKWPVCPMPPACACPVPVFASRVCWMWPACLLPTGVSCKITAQRFPAAWMLCLCGASVLPRCHARATWCADMYVAVKGGEQAILNSWRLLAERRRGDTAVPELTLRQIREQLGLVVDRVMAEGSLYDPELAALAIKQAQGDIVEAVFLLRAYRTTLPRLAASLPIDTAGMALERRISATFKDVPGGQVLGATYDYTQRLLDFDLAVGSPLATAVPAPVAVRPLSDAPCITDLMGTEGLLAAEMPPPDDADPCDLTREPLTFPAGRALRLQNL